MSVYLCCLFILQGLKAESFLRELQFQELNPVQQLPFLQLLPAGNNGLVITGEGEGIGGTW